MLWHDLPKYCARVKWAGLCGYAKAFGQVFSREVALSICPVALQRHSQLRELDACSFARAPAECLQVVIRFGNLVAPASRLHSHVVLRQHVPHQLVRISDTVVVSE